MMASISTPWGHDPCHAATIPILGLVSHACAHSEPATPRPKRLLNNMLEGASVIPYE
ncbi:hypothetical protein VFPBJ_06620 [Purpureocillium lilacinum]|uniref:Uncharacterized protein n=1 Tax=Purpureocillium lilacinum TaxID=33203 RepID=A0A179GMV5_PURLI|nr:hypothetical protein VFPBJ_06620 [Purpureocillium lilacinum]